MSILFGAAWLVSGFVGNLSIWKADNLDDWKSYYKYSYQAKPSRCPTPFAIAICILFSFVGLFTLMVGTFSCIGSYFVCVRAKDEKTGQRSWWFRPVCADKVEP